MLHVRQVHAEAAKNNYNYKYINTYIYKDRRGEYHPIPHDEARGQGRQKEDGFFPGWEKAFVYLLDIYMRNGYILKRDNRQVLRKGEVLWLSIFRQRR